MRGYRSRTRDRSITPVLQYSAANPQPQGQIDIDDAMTQQIFTDDAKVKPILTADNPQLAMDDAQGNQVYVDDAKTNPIQGED